MDPLKQRVERIDSRLRGFSELGIPGAFSELKRLQGRLTLFRGP